MKKKRKREKEEKQNKKKKKKKSKRKKRKRNRKRKYIPSRYITNRYTGSVSFFKGNPTQSYVLIQI